MDEMYGINPGDVVRLKSDHQLMIVRWIAPDPKTVMACCTYLNESNEEKIIKIQPITLEKVSDKEIARIRKSELKMKKSKAGATWSDKAAKWAALISAIGVIILGILNIQQKSSIDKLKTNIDTIQSVVKSKNGI